MRPVIAAYIALAVLLATLATTGGVALYRASGPDSAIEAAADEHGYSLVSWELRHAAEKWVYKVAHFFDGRSHREEDDIVQRYFSLAETIRQLEPQGVSAELVAAQKERGAIEGEVEDVIEGRVTAVLEEQGLVLRPPLFSDLGLIFPPVDFELDAPPRVLVISPRERIELDRSYLLAAGLDLDTVVGIERESEADNMGESGVSTLVISTGGVAAYPSIVSELDSYESLIDTVFHEWLHQYLIFFPLGSSYARNSETRTLNESVANLGGHELARLYFERYGRLVAAPTPALTLMGEFDFTKEMRELRRRVEALLQLGRIAEAETLMTEKRDEFEAKGVYIRRLNQAYFAFHGFYADTPGSIDPIGPKLQMLLERAGSPGEFVRRAAGITSAEQLDELLE